MHANMEAMFSKAGNLCYLAFVFFVSIHLFNFLSESEFFHNLGNTYFWSSR